VVVDVVALGRYSGLRVAASVCSGPEGGEVDFEETLASPRGVDLGDLVVRADGADDVVEGAVDEASAIQGYTSPSSRAACTHLVGTAIALSIKKQTDIAHEQLT
jgi:hypothetical protein